MPRLRQVRCALRLEYDDLDDRVVELAAPTGRAMDVMQMVDE